MTATDRTLEFNAIAEDLLRRGSIKRPPTHTSPHSTASPLRQRSEFARRAAEIGRDIHETSVKLQKLSQLAKKKTLFDDPSADIQEWTFIIKQDINNLNKKIEALEQHVSSNNKQTQSHAESIVTSLKTNLQSTTKTFKHVLQTRTESIKAKQERHKQLVGSPSTFAAPRAAESPLYKAAPPDFNPGNGQEVAILMPQSMLQNDYHVERADLVENIERTIVELGGIFTHLATMVREQGEMLERIDQNAESALLDTEAAAGQLERYLHSISSNRWLIFKMFMVLIVFIILFVVFFV